MTNNKVTTATWRNHRMAGAIGLLLAGGLTGGVVAATPASAAGFPTSTATAPTVRVALAHWPTGVHAGAKALTGPKLESASAAALKSVPGATIYRAETDARVRVKLDRHFKVTSIHHEMGASGPVGPGGPRGQMGKSAGGPAPGGFAGGPGERHGGRL
jgi:hypothetical protein